MAGRASDTCVNRNGFQPPKATRPCSQSSGTSTIRIASVRLARISDLHFLSGKRSKRAYAGSLQKGYYNGGCVNIEGI